MDRMFCDTTNYSVILWKKEWSKNLQKAEDRYNCWTLNNGYEARKKTRGNWSTSRIVW